jgi:hypothetical protein
LDGVGLSRVIGKDRAGGHRLGLQRKISGQTIRQDGMEKNPPIFVAFRIPNTQGSCRDIDIAAL